MTKFYGNLYFNTSLKNSLIFLLVKAIIFYIGRISRFILRNTLHYSSFDEIYQMLYISRVQTDLFKFRCKKYKTCLFFYTTKETVTVTFVVDLSVLGQLKQLFVFSYVNACKGTSQIGDSPSTQSPRICQFDNKQWSNLKKKTQTVYVNY